MENGQTALVGGANRGIGREVVHQLAARARSVEEGVNTPVWAAMLPCHGPIGGFFCDRRQISWYKKPV